MSVKRRLEADESAESTVKKRQVHQDDRPRLVKSGWNKIVAEGLRTVGMGKIKIRRHREQTRLDGASGRPSGQGPRAMIIKEGNCDAMVVKACGVQGVPARGKGKWILTRRVTVMTAMEVAKVEEAETTIGKKVDGEITSKKRKWGDAAVRGVAWASGSQSSWKKGKGEFTNTGRFRMRECIKPGEAVLSILQRDESQFALRPKAPGMLEELVAGVETARQLAKNTNTADQDRGYWAAWKDYCEMYDTPEWRTDMTANMGVDLEGATREGVLQAGFVIWYYQHRIKRGRGRECPGWRHQKGSRKPTSNL